MTPSTWICLLVSLASDQKGNAMFHHLDPDTVLRHHAAHIDRSLAARSQRRPRNPVRRKSDWPAAKRLIARLRSD
jgi:hypothetical protein